MHSLSNIQNTLDASSRHKSMQQQQHTPAALSFLMYVI